jgi:hypothetical protein
MERGERGVQLGVASEEAHKIAVVQVRVLHHGRWGTTSKKRPTNQSPITIHICRWPRLRMGASPIDTAGTFVGASITWVALGSFALVVAFLSFFLDCFLCISGQIHPTCWALMATIVLLLLVRLDHISLFIFAVLCTNTGKKDWSARRRVASAPSAALCLTDRHRRSRCCWKGGGQPARAASASSRS